MNMRGSHSKYDRFRGREDENSFAYRGRYGDNIFFKVLSMIGNMLKWILIGLTTLIVSHVLDAALILLAITLLPDSLLSQLALHISKFMAIVQRNMPNTTAPTTSFPPQPQPNIYSTFGPSSTTNT